jgi:SOS response regulatory protein OraA/RecX
MLSYRSRSGHEITADLRGKGYSQEVISKVISDLQDRGWLDDNELAHDIISYGQDRKKGWMRIYADLRKRGIGRDLAEESLDRYYDEQKAKESLRWLVQENLATYSTPPCKKEIDTIIRRISRQGFLPLSVKGIVYDLSRDKGWQEVHTGLLDSD